MTRGIFALLTFAATLVTAQPAPAAAPPLAVIELARYRSGGPRELTVFVVASSAGKPGVLAFLGLAPAKGGGWTRSRFTVAMFHNGDTRVRAYGADATIDPPCPGPAEVCGAAGRSSVVAWMLRVKPAAGHRYFVAAPPDSQVFVSAPWQPRPVGLGARVVVADDAPAVGAAGPNGWYEAFHSATAPGGKYGSAAFAMMPCEGAHSVGSATLKSDGSDPAAVISCKPGGYYGAFSGTADGRKWSVTGPVAGETEYPFRLLVMDLPKR